MGNVKIYFVMVKKAESSYSSEDTLRFLKGNLEIFGQEQKIKLKIKKINFNW